MKNQIDQTHANIIHTSTITEFFVCNYSYNTITLVSCNLY